ncbi:MAG: hypothetical protein HYU28_04540 [Actinobacteria bacterium]|nr:hypothetical protein [Actinomycetota bacterium]
MARRKLKPPTSRRRPGRGGRKVNVGWWTTVSALVVFGTLGIVFSRGGPSAGDIVREIVAPDIAGAKKIAVTKVMKEAYDRVKEGDELVEVKAGDTTRMLKAPTDGFLVVTPAPGLEVKPGETVATVQTGPDFRTSNEGGQHWHTAIGVNVCGTWLPDVGEFEADFHSHGDGLIHAHPGSTSHAGKNAKLGTWYELGGLELTATKLKYSDGKTYRSGEVECGEGKDKKKAVLRWALNGKEQESNPANFVVGNGDVVALAFVPEKGDFDTLPPSAATMAQNYVAPKHPDFVPEETTTTTTPGATTTTVAGATATTTTSGGSGGP